MARRADADGGRRGCASMVAHGGDAHAGDSEPKGPTAGAHPRDRACTRAVADTPRDRTEVGAWVLATEIFGWRQIQNRRELAALVGVVPAPYQSGETYYDQGIRRAGNTHVRRIMVHLAWGWLRFQPQSALTLWYQRRFSSGKRLRRVGIVALARKLLIALWRYLETGAIPEGAELKSMRA